VHSRRAGLPVKTTASFALSPTRSSTPATPASGPGLAQALAPGPDTRPLLLYVDDSATQRAVVTALLSRTYRVVTAEDGAAALTSILAETPHVILSDLQMVGMDGEALLRRLKSDPALRLIPFILVTGEGNAATHSMELGADDFLQKPYGPEELHARVDASVRISRMVRELRAQHAEMIRIHCESKRLELELHQAQKLEAVGRLAAGIAHEINTPIQFIGDNTHFLGDAFRALEEMLALQRQALERAAPAEAEALGADAERLELTYFLDNVAPTVRQTIEGVERVASIVRAMKEFAHPDQKEMVATDLNRSLLATLDVARNEYKYVAEVETELGELPLVTCHAGDLNQVFLNLLVNAAHAIGDRVKGTSAKGKIRVTTSLDGGHVTLTVSDTGGGIPEAIQDKVFEPFFTTKEVGRGTGQGLAIARNIVEQHRGTIHFETVVGEGTIFLIRLPVSPEPPGQESP